jgi:hypothetical protein
MPGGRKERGLSAADRVIFGRSAALKYKDLTKFAGHMRRERELFLPIYIDAPILELHPIRFLRSAAFLVQCSKLKGGR